MFLAVVLGALVALFAGCGDTQYVSTATLPDNGPSGNVYVSSTNFNDGYLQCVDYGQRSVVVNEFAVAVDDVEDGILEFVIPEIYSSRYQELLQENVLHNIRLTQNDIQASPTATSVMPRQASPENGWVDTTYAYIPCGVLIPKGKVVTFRIVADIGWSLLEQIVVTLPDAGTGMFSGGIGSHIVVRGATSGKILHVHGEALGSPVLLFDPFFPGKG
ncbi:TPA: hypothetical protein DDZ49_03670 [Candidatus Wolfebacteria bacterium]|nr:MAG: hypothetical protein UY00_C0047G0013 [Candidatus Wolfebacteria bacterium GW2011_GWA1_47_6]HAL24337.1 hypothetical protein [Candidatus Wolfebacteria bacterium]HAS95626.1 hypothetical protein [Candidatus Wolfebacteria bacterium]HBD18014.1 hypothetical protein [Candidatus Wolfebacteria bacterium]HBN87233.1 hypothetical protein [Candidatus Wolfebacteria bacterium]